jgi:lipid II:glycine glycyltransferase (peptidoglycan interpeptide bridge formation enzyme)
MTIDQAGPAPTPGPASRALDVRPADARELEAWDDLTVRPGGGHILQSMAWARHRAASGWRPHHLVVGDGSAVLALERRWPIIGGGSAYLPRGPIPSGDLAAVARRLEAVTAWLAGHGIDVIATDAEVPGATGYGARLAAIGFHQIEEIQPARHRFSLPLGRGADEPGILAEVAKSTRQRIRAAEGAGIVVVRHDAEVEGGAADSAHPGAPDAPPGRVPGAAGPGEGFVAPTETTAVALDRFYDLLLATGERRHFRFGPRPGFLAWWRAAHAARLLVLLEARTADGTPIAGLVLYRHGGRLTTAHSADDAATRQGHPGALHLLRWRAIQLAIREGCAEMDLGGVDVPGARHEPLPGEPMYGLAEHKRAFGAVFLELAGAHERVIRPWRYALGRVAARAVRSRGGAR